MQYHWQSKRFDSLTINASRRPCVPAPRIDTHSRGEAGASVDVMIGCCDSMRMSISHRMINLFEKLKEDLMLTMCNAQSMCRQDREGDLHVGSEEPEKVGATADRPPPP